MESATKICLEVGGYQHCDKCPIYYACSEHYSSTEEFEEALERAATAYLERSNANE